MDIEVRTRLEPAGTGSTDRIGVPNKNALPQEGVGWNAGAQRLRACISTLAGALVNSPSLTTSSMT
jgi:hypothetical protein